jgi:hypothetical protein
MKKASMMHTPELLVPDPGTSEVKLLLQVKKGQIFR